MTVNPALYAPLAAGMSIKGDTGDPGSTAFKGVWVTSTVYAARDEVTHTISGYGVSTFICISGHTSGSSTEPEVGASWATKWTKCAGGGANGAGSGTLTKSGSFVTDQVVGCADTGYGIKALGAFGTLMATALNALPVTTTAPDGDVDYVLTKESGGWKLKLVDKFAQRKIAVPIPAQAWTPSSTSGCGDPTNAELATNKMNIKSLAFGYSTKTYACYKLKLPGTYDGGYLYAYFEWHSTGTTSNGVRWGIQMASVGDNETLDATWGTAIEVTDNATGAATRNLITSQFVGITPSGTPAAGETLEIRIYRDPAHADDNLNEAVLLDDVTIIIPTNKYGEA